MEKANFDSKELFNLCYIMYDTDYRDFTHLRP